MNRGLSGTLVFASLSGIFAVLYFLFARDPALLAGAVFSGIIGFRFQEPIGMRRWFPIGMLLLFLLVLGTLPIRGPRLTVVHTAVLLLSMRGLFLALTRIRERGEGPDRSGIALSAGLAIQFFVSLAQVAYSFRSATPEPVVPGILDLRALAILAALFTPMARAGALLVALTFLPGLRVYRDSPLIALALLEAGFAFMRSRS